MKKDSLFKKEIKLPEKSFYWINIVVLIILIGAVVYAEKSVNLEKVNVYNTIDAWGFLVLILSICYFFISAYNQGVVYKLWQAEKPDWKNKMIVSYVLLFIVIFSLPALIEISNEYSTGPRLSMFLLWGFWSSSSFLFPLGIVMAILKKKGSQYKETRPKSYLIITGIFAAIFTILCAIPALLTYITFLIGKPPLAM